MSDAWLSTKALSVYNVLLKAKQPLSQDEVRLFLQRAHRPDIDDEYVSMGTGYLLARGFVSDADGRIAMARPEARLKRVNGDIDLDWAT